jgi:hypothetical protein
MSWHFSFAVLVAGITAFAPPACAGQQAGASPLHTGDPFPQVSGQTLTNKPLALPAAAAGKPAFVVFSFSRAAGKDARLWNERVFKEYSNSNAIRTVVLDYYQYLAVPGNTTQLRIFQRRVNWLWRSVLIRRSQRAQVRWERLTPLLNRWIPQPHVLHPYPDARFYATHPS